MDKKETLIRKFLLTCAVILVSPWIYGQEVKEIKICDKKYEYGINKDSITLYFNILNEDGERNQHISEDELCNYLVFKEDNNIIPSSSRNIYSVNSGQRIPSDYTFSVLVDLSIPVSGKTQIYHAIKKLVESAPDGCVYLSFFGDSISQSKEVTKENFNSFKDQFAQESQYKYLYGALYAKLSEFSNFKKTNKETNISNTTYKNNIIISERAAENIDKNILFVFTEGSTSPSFEENTGFVEVTELQQIKDLIVPTVYAFYYTEEGKDTSIENVLQGICNPHIEGRTGEYMPSNNISQVLKDFEKIVNDKMYDFAFKYQATKSKTYTGKIMYNAEWKGDIIGESEISIGTTENPWPVYSESTTSTIIKYIFAIIITILTILFFFIIIKIIIPLIQSKSFEIKYYKKYVPDVNISRRICHYCKQEIKEGQEVVVKCKHVMHVHCWKENGYKCAEYGQNCKIGIQQHVDWKDILTLHSFKECHLTIAGIFAGFISWVLYELTGRGGLSSLSNNIVSLCYTPNEGFPNLTTECINKTCAFLMIGLFLGFFLSVIFRYNDEYRKRDLKICLKIFSLSLITSLIGLFSFALGACILCMMLSALDLTYIPWYCSFPAYILFSLSISLALTIKSTIPLKSAIIGGSCSAIIGFMVLYFSSLDNSNTWMNMLLDFIIYGGGLGASLVTVRMLAEKYFLVIQNGVRSEQRIPIHKWMNATGGGNKVTIGMTGDCEIQMNWEKSNKVAKEHAQIFIDYEKQLPMIKPLATGVIYNTRVELPVGKNTILNNGDTFKIGDTIFQYIETE